MTLEEILEYVSEEYLDDRTALIDGDNDDLWSDKLIVRQLNRAQDILCRRAWSIIDIANSTAGVITLATNKSVYALHKSVLRVLAVVPSDQDAPIENYDDDALLAPQPQVTSWWPNIDSTGVAATGRPIGYSTEIGSRLLRVYRTPSSTENGLKLNMRVARMPLCYLDLKKPTESPEVPAEYHMLIADYACGKCLTMPNVDGAFRSIGEGLLKDWKDGVKEARQERQRAEANKATWMFSSATANLR